MSIQTPPSVMVGSLFNGIVVLGGPGVGGADQVKASNGKVEGVPAPSLAPGLSTESRLSHPCDNSG